MGSIPTGGTTHEFQALLAKHPALTRTNRVRFPGDSLSRRDGLMGSRLFREQEIAGSTPAAPTTGASSNGRAVVLQTADGGSIPSAPTVASQFIPRSTVVSRPLKPVTLVRLQLGEQMVAVVYWRACLAVNEEVRVRSPPVTPTQSGTLEGFPNPPAMLRGEQSSPSSHAPRER